MSFDAALFCESFQIIDYCVGEIITDELATEVNLFVHILREREGNVFVRSYFYSEEIGEIAARYGITACKVTVMLNCTRGKLMQHLEKEGFEKCYGDGSGDKISNMGGNAQTTGNESLYGIWTKPGDLCASISWIVCAAVGGMFECARKV